MRSKAITAMMLTLLLTSMLTLAFNIQPVSAGEYPVIYIDPPSIIDPTLAPGKNLTISIKTNCTDDIWAWQFTLTYDPRVLHGGIRKTDTRIGDNVTREFYTTGKPVVPNSEVVYVDETLMTRETEGNDTWTGDGETTKFYTTGKPVVPNSEVVYVDETLMTREIKGNDTWTGDGVATKFYTTHKPLVRKAGREVRVWVNGTLKQIYRHYNVSYSEGIIEFHTPPEDGVKIEATYWYGHYYAKYSEDIIEFYELATPAQGAEVKATYKYVQYTIDYAEGSIKFTTAPSEGAKVEVKYLYGGITNGDLINKDKDPTARFMPGTFNNTIGKLSLTGAFFMYLGWPQPLTSGPGTLANVTFTVVGFGACNITLGSRTVLLGFTDDGYGDMYYIIDAETMPDHIQHGYFDNRALTAAVVDVNPDALNLKSMGEWITCYIELPEGYNVSDIDIYSIMLNNTFPVSLLPNPPVPVPTKIGDYDNDTIPDLMVKFNRTELTSHIYHVLGIKYGEVTLTISGNLTDGTPFEGSDTIKVIFGGDVNDDGSVDSTDLGIFGVAWSPGSYNPDCDFNLDGVVDSTDYGLLATNYGATVP